MSGKLHELKNRIKLLASSQKDLKSQRKLKYDGERHYTQSDASELVRSNKYELRHLHIAYCELRGTDYYAIENNCNIDNQPSISFINSIKEQYRDEEEAIRISA